MAKTPHKHAEVIKEWADGATIQYRCDDRRWQDCEPSWSDDLEYRVKPEPVVRYGKMIVGDGRSIIVCADGSEPWPAANIRVTVTEGTITDVALIK